MATSFRTLIGTAQPAGPQGPQGPQGYTGSSGSGGGGSLTVTSDTSSTTLYPMSAAYLGSITQPLVTTAKFTFNASTGQLNATSFNSLSDLLKKENIETIEQALKIVNAIRGVKFDWADHTGRSVGVIAQEVETVLPDLVSTSEESVKTVNYSGIVAVLVEAVKELAARVEELERKTGDK